MNGLKLATDAFGVLCELVIIRYYFTYLIGSSIASKRFFYLLNGFCLVLMTGSTLIPDRQWVMPLLAFVSIYLLSFLFSKRWYVKFFYSVILIVLFLLSEEIIGAILVFTTEIDIKNLWNDSLMYIIGLLVSKLLMFFFIKIIGYKRLGIYKNITPRVFLGLLLMPISSIVAMYTIGISLVAYAGGQTMFIVLCASILLCVSNYFVFYLFEAQIKTEHMKAQLAFAEKQIEYYKELCQRHSEIHTLSHDMKQYMSGLWGFIQEGNLEEIGRCVKNILTNLKSADHSFDTGHPALDAIIRFKKQSMDGLNIRFDSLVSLPEQLSVDVLDLCVILGNGLDNAIEACAKLPEGQEGTIRLAVKGQSKYISIGIENPTDQPELSEKTTKTTKQNSFYHGLGLKSIQTIADKYDGSMRASINDHVFKLAVLVKNG